MIQLKPLGTLAITVGDRTVQPGIPTGTRVVGEVKECRFSGERLNAVEHGSSGSDWFTAGAGDIAAVDCRMMLRTDDDAIIFLRYTGRAHYKDGKAVGIVAAPTFETADERYAWLNSVQAVAIGKRVGWDLEYEFYEVTDDSFG